METLSNEIAKEVKAIEDIDTEVFDILGNNCINIDFEDLERRLTIDELDFIESNF